jgi:hypothetical protein
MLPYAETLMPRWKKLTGGSIPAPFHFSNFEESVLQVEAAETLRTQPLCSWRSALNVVHSGRRERRTLDAASAVTFSVTQRLVSPSGDRRSPFTASGARVDALKRTTDRRNMIGRCPAAASDDPHACFA